MHARGKEGFEPWFDKGDFEGRRLDRGEAGRGNWAHRRNLRRRPHGWRRVSWLGERGQGIPPLHRAAVRVGLGAGEALDDLRGPDRRHFAPAISHDLATGARAFWRFPHRPARARSVVGACRQWRVGPRVRAGPRNSVRHLTDLLSDLGANFSHRAAEIAPHLSDGMWLNASRSSNGTGRARAHNVGDALRCSRRYASSSVSGAFVASCSAPHSARGTPKARRMVSGTRVAFLLVASPLTGTCKPLLRAPPALPASSRG